MTAVTETAPVGGTGNGMDPNRHEPEASPPRRRRRWTGIVALVVLAMTVLVAGVVFDPTNLFDADEAAIEAGRDTATVEIADLTSEVEADGQLLFATPLNVVNEGVGTLVSMAEEGSVVVSGEVLYRVDDQPVLLLDGSVPAYRSLTVDDEGPDVAQLEQALVDLGYDPDGRVTVDEDYTWTTADMVETWQDDVGLEAIGELALGTVVFAPGPVRVGARVADPGDALQAGTAVMEIAATDRVVEFAVDATDRTALQVGDSVIVELPDRRSLEATVTAYVPAADGTWVATAVLVDPEDLPALDRVPVDVSWTQPIAVAAKIVPAAAIVRLDSGRYAVEVMLADGSTDFVPVEIGVVTGRTVQITAEGVEAGTIVIAP